MSAGEYPLQQEHPSQLVYRLHRWFFAASIVVGTAATAVMVATNPGYYQTQTGEAALLAGYASAGAVMVQIHLIASVITFSLLPLDLVVMAWLASVGAFLVLLGMLPLPAIGAGVESLTYDVVRAGSNPSLVNLVQRFNADGIMSFYNVVDVPGIVLGPALIGLALWRAGRSRLGSGARHRQSPAGVSLPGVFVAARSLSPAAELRAALRRQHSVRAGGVRRVKERAR